jgi:hypothetical protein
MPFNTDATALSHWSEPLADFLLNLFWSSLPSALLYAGVGLVVAIVLMVWVARKKLLRRRPRLWNVLAKLSYVLILAGAVFGASAIGVVRHVQQQTMSIFESAAVPLVRANTVVLREYVTAKLASFAPGQPVTARELVDATLKDLYYQPTSDSLWERGKARIVNWTLRKLGGEVLTAVFQKIIIAKVEGMAAALKTDMHGQEQGEAVSFGADVLKKVLLDANRKLDLTVLDRTLPQIILDAARQQIGATFHSVYLMIAMVLLAIAAIVGGEMLLYFRWFEKRNAAAPSSV